MEKILATLTAELGLTALTSISNSRIAGSAQIENRLAVSLPVAAPRGAASSPANLFMRSPHYG